MTLTEIHEMVTDALAGEEIQLFEDGKWRTVYENYAFYHTRAWRIKPTIEVNGVLMSKRQANDAWDASDATSYEMLNILGNWVEGEPPAPDFYADAGLRYRWTTAKWIYVNGVAIVPEGGNTNYGGHWVANKTDGLKLIAAINALVEVK